MALYDRTVGAQKTGRERVRASERMRALGVAMAGCVARERERRGEGGVSTKIEIMRGVPFGGAKNGQDVTETAGWMTGRSCNARN